MRSIDIAVMSGTERLQAMDSLRDSLAQEAKEITLEATNPLLFLLRGFAPSREPFPAMRSRNER